MKTKILMMSILVGLPALGCSSSNTDCPANDGSLCTYMNYDIGSSEGGTVISLPPVPPFIGMQIDRVGRPLVNLILTDPFNQVTGMTLGQVQDAYNASLPTAWPTYQPIPYIAQNLGIWDGVDGTCGNQYQASSTVNATTYMTLATTLANDYLTIDTTKGTCAKYLALELGDTMNCGGRPPNLPGNTNVVDTTLNLLQGGFTNSTNPAVPLGTGVTSDPAGAASNTTLPFLLPPN
jgi:hypothetical protein